MKHIKRWTALLMAVLLIGQNTAAVMAETMYDSDSDVLLTSTDTEDERIDIDDLDAADALQDDVSADVVDETEILDEDSTAENDADEWDETDSEDSDEAETDAEAPDDEEEDLSIDGLSNLAWDDEEEPILDDEDSLFDEEGEAEEIELEQEDALLGASSSKIKSAYEKTAKKLLALAKEYPPTLGSINGDWQIFGLARSSQTVSDEIYTTYYGTVVKTTKELKGVLSEKQYTTYSRAIIALTSIGYDVTDVGGYNLLKPLADYDQTVWQGLNGAIYALIALDTRNYTIPKVSKGKTQTTREKLIANILEAQLSNGGWTYSGTIADTDMTAMAMQALAPYYSTNKKVKKAVDAGLVCLAELQLSDGGFGTYGGTTGTSESSSQVVTALSALGIDANKDERFISNNTSALDALLAYQNSDGTFKHLMSGSADQMATEQAFYALAAYQRYKNKENSLYDLSDVSMRSDKDKAKEVIALINKIPSKVTLSAKEKVTAAQALYQSLSKKQKKLISAKKVKKLKNAVSTINKLEIEKVEKMIKAIGTVTKDKQSQVTQAYNAYNQLTSSQKKSVSNYATLKTAIATLKTLLSGSQSAQGSTKTIGSGTTKSTTGTGTTTRRVTSSGSSASTKSASAGTKKSSGSTKSTSGTTSSKKKNSTKKSTKTEEDAGAACLKKLNKLLKSIDDDATEYSDEEIGDIISLYQTYEELSQTDQQTVQEDDAYQTFQEILDTLGRQNHEDRAAGVDISENDVSILPWYIQLQIEELDTADYEEKIGNALGGEGSMYDLYDISFINLLDGSEWEPEEALKLRMVRPTLADGENPLVVHINDDAGLEFMEVDEAGSYIEFAAIEFSGYGVVGYAGTLENLMTPVAAEEDEPAVPLWIIIAGIVAVLLLLLLAAARFLLGRERNTGISEGM